MADVAESQSRVSAAQLCFEDYATRREKARNDGVYVNETLHDPGTANA